MILPPLRRCLPGAAAALLVTSSLSCGSPYQEGRPTTIKVARSDDPWLAGELCPLGPPVVPPFEVLAPGTGAPVGPGDTVRVHYVASLRDGTVVHDTHDGGMPSEIVLGSTHTLCGVERGIEGARPGEQRRVTVPSALAFAEAGHPPEVPPNADLVFVIDVYLPASFVSEPGTRPSTSSSAGGTGGGRSRGGGRR